MINRERIYDTTFTEDIVSAHCIHCNKAIDIQHNMLVDAGTLVADFGYGSSLDESKWEGAICDSCFKTIFKPKMKKFRTYSRTITFHEEENDNRQGVSEQD